MPCTSLLGLSAWSTGGCPRLTRFTSPIRGPCRRVLGPRSPCLHARVCAPAHRPAAPLHRQFELFWTWSPDAPLRLRDPHWCAARTTEHV